MTTEFTPSVCCYFESKIQKIHKIITRYIILVTDNYTLNFQYGEDKQLGYGQYDGDVMTFTCKD